jgi:hypothetical protein
MLKFSSLVIEMIEDELERLRRAGRIVVDRLYSGPYKIFLLKNEFFGYGTNYDVALTSDEEEFTTVHSQRDRKLGREMMDIARNWRKISNKLKQWTIEYGQIRVGSMNPRKTQKYHSILSAIGFNLSEIEQKLGGTSFMIYPDSQENLDSN